MKGPRKQNLLIKNCVFIFTCLKYSLFDAILRLFFPLLKTLFLLVSFEAFWCFCQFLFHLFHMGETFSFEDFFHPGKQQQQRIAQGEIGRIGGVEHRGAGMPFLAQYCRNSAQCGQVCSQTTHREMNTLEEF